MLARLSLLLLLLVPAAQALENLYVVGEARSLKDGELRYREYHHCSEDRRQCQVLYRDADGSLFARKHIDYSESASSPSVVVEDLREGRTLRLQGRDEPDLVVDAGFDNYVRERWNELSRGETVRFPFLIAGRDSPVPMKASSKEGGACKGGRLCLSVSLDAWLVSLLVEPIRLVYDSERRLLQYQGISNIRDGDGRSQQVRIDYEYADPEG